MLKLVKQLLAIEIKKKNGLTKYLKNSVDFADKAGRYIIDVIILVVWLQMHIVVALNLWGNAVINMVFWLL